MRKRAYRSSVKYLQEVDGALRYRRRVPTDLQSIIGKKEWIHALGLAVGQESHAAKIVADYNLAYASVIAQARVQRVVNGSPFAPPAPHPQATAQTAVQAPKLPKVKLSEAYAYDLETHGGQRDEKVFQVSVDSVVSLMGDVDVVAMTPKDVQIWIGKCEEKGQKPTTIKRRINALHAILARYFRDHEIDRRNPFSNTRVKEGTGTKSDRLPFHTSHLKLIDRYFQTAPRLSDDIRRIVPLMKLTGGRPLEIGGLDASDILLDHEVPHIWIRNNAHRRIKTKGSERRIPLVGDALVAAKEAKEAHPAGAVFSATSRDTNALSQRLNKFIRRAGVPKSSRLVAYSFRHTLEEALRSAGVREHTQKRIMGHTDSSITGRYGAPAGMLEELRNAIRDASRVLGRVDISIYTSSEF
ncbi:MAG: tyrosine-type recombinase/integrase [Pseudomonadota bacterium]